MSPTAKTSVPLAPQTPKSVVEVPLDCAAQFADTVMMSNVLLVTGMPSGRVSVKSELMASATSV